MTKKPATQKSLPLGPAPDTKRARFVRRWVDGKLKRLAGLGLFGGLGSTIMALPALAQATSADLEAFQFAEAIPGVQSAKVLSNGDVQLKMVDGRRLIVSVENVQILENGAIMVADDVVAQITEFSVAAEAGAATAASGGVSGAGLALGGLGVAGAAAGAGGGGGDSGDDTENESSSTPTSTPRPPSLNLAELQANSLSNVSTQSTTPENTATVEVEIGALTKLVSPAADGSWSVSLTQAEAEALPQGISTVTIKHLDTDGVEISGDSKQFDIDTIPPNITITTFSDGNVLNSQEHATDLTIAGTTDAENGQTISVHVNGQTYSGKAMDGGWSVTVPASDLAGLPDGETIDVTADVTDRAGNPAVQATNSFSTDFTAPALALDPVAGGSIELIDVSSDLILSGSTTAEDGQVVAVEFQGNTYSGTVSGGGWNVTIPQADLSTLETGTPVSVNVTVSDLAGNATLPVNAVVPVDLSGPSIGISPLSIGQVLNLAESGSDLVIGGTTGNVQDGQQVTVALDGQTYTGTVSGGAWSISVPTSALSALADGGDFTLTANVSDADGLAAPQANVDFSKDVTIPTLSVDGFSHGAIVNASERDADLVISGTTDAEDGQVVSVSFNGQTYTGAVSSGSWSAVVPSEDLDTLPNGATISVTADVFDAAGNPAVQASGDIATDFTAPTSDPVSLSSGVTLNISEQSAGLTVSGGSDAPNGTVVAVELRQSDGTLVHSGTSSLSGGAWTYAVSPVVLSGLSDAEAYTVTASISDAAGNVSTATAGFNTDLSAPSVSIAPIPFGNVLDIVEQGADALISGTTTAENGQTVTVDLGGTSYSALVSNGAWSTTVPSSDLAALTDGMNYAVTAQVEDAAGNTASIATTSFTTDFRPLLYVDELGSNDALELSTLQSTGVAISGSSVGLADGQAIDISLNSSVVGSVNVGADGSWTFDVPASEFSSFDPGDALDFSVQANVSGGSDPLPVSEQVVAHASAAYAITEADRSGSTVTFEIYADPDRDISGGLAFTAELEFDPAVVTYDTGSEAENGAFDLFLANPSGASAVNFAGAATSYGDLSQPIVTFTMTILDPGQQIDLTLTTPDGGPVRFSIGTDGSDTLTSTTIDDVIRGGSGDDTIDLTGAGRDVVVFEANPNDNGFDFVKGFTLGPASEVSDALAFSGLDLSSLRGSGSDIEVLNVGDAIGDNTGFVTLQTSLADLNESTIETAAEGLGDAGAGDEVYVLATDGTDSVLAKVNYSAPGSASVETVAQFEGLSDLSGLNSDNILLNDATGASA